MQSDQGLHCLLSESLDTTECMNREQRSREYFMHVQDNQNLHILCMFDGTFVLDHHSGSNKIHRFFVSSQY